MEATRFRHRMPKHHNLCVIRGKVAEFPADDMQDVMALWLSKTDSGYRHGTFFLRARLTVCTLALAMCLAGQSASGAAAENYSTRPFLDEFSGPSIDTGRWVVATWREHGAQTGAERVETRDGLARLTLVYDPDQGILSSAIQTRQEFLYGRWEARLKASNVDGVLNAMFLVDWDNTSTTASSSDGSKQEVDIEFLTRTFRPGRGEVHLAMHAAGRKSWRRDLRLPFNPSEDFHVWGLDISPTAVEWFADGRSIARYEYVDGDITIDRPYILKILTRSQRKWIGGPPKAGIPSILEIDWIRFTPAE